MLAAMGTRYVSPGPIAAEVPGLAEPVCFGADLIECSTELTRLLMAVDLCPQGAHRSRIQTIHTKSIAFALLVEGENEKLH